MIHIDQIIGLVAAAGVSPSVKPMIDSEMVKILVENKKASH